MKNKIQIYILLALLGIAPQSWGVSEVEQQISITADSTVNISAAASANNGTIRAQDGYNVSAITGSFDIKTNLPGGYDFIFCAKVNTQGSQENALFDKAGKPYIILGNLSSPPSAASISNIKTSPAALLNPNAIAYSFSVAAGPAGVTATSGNSKKADGNCFFVNLSRNKTAKVSGTINPGAPYANTYSSANDKPGTYQVILFLSAYRI